MVSELILPSPHAYWTACTHTCPCIPCRLEGTQVKNMRGRSGIEGKTAKVSRSDPAAEGIHSLSRKPCCGNKQPQEISVLEESHTSQEQKDQWALSQRRMGREYKTPEDIKTNFPRSDETRHWNINLIELFIKHKWTFIHGRAEFVNRNGHSPPRQIASSFCGDNCLEESRGRDGKRKAECVACLPQCSEVWSWLTRDWKWENAYMG